MNMKKEGSSLKHKFLRLIDPRPCNELGQEQTAMGRRAHDVTSSNISRPSWSLSVTEYQRKKALFS